MPPPERLLEPLFVETEGPADPPRPPAPPLPSVAPVTVVEDDLAGDESAEDELPPAPAARAAEVAPNANIRTVVLTKACMGTTRW